jgi:predicted patatin/cPLA2 family phospholipase
MHWNMASGSISFVNVNVIFSNETVVDGSISFSVLPIQTCQKHPKVVVKGSWDYYAAEQFVIKNSLIVR